MSNGNLPVEAQQALQVYEKQGCNILLPTVMMEVSDLHRVRVEEVRLSPDPKDGDFYPQDTKKVGNEWVPARLSHTKVGLLKLASVAGIQWHPTETRIITASRDYVLYQAMAFVRKPSGEFIHFKASKELDMQVVEETKREEYTKKAQYNKALENASEREKQAWIETSVKREVLRIREHKVSHAETKAMERVVRGILQIKATYTPEEAAKPFVVVRIDVQPDLKDPEIRRMLSLQSMQAGGMLFGNMGPAQAPSFSQQSVGSTVHDLSDSGNIVDMEEVEDFTIEQEMPSQPATGKEGVFCDECGAEIKKRGEKSWSPTAIANYSKKNFGAVLCPDCQAKRKAGGAK